MQSVLVRLFPYSTCAPGPAQRLLTMCGRDLCHALAHAIEHLLPRVGHLLRHVEDVIVVDTWLERAARLNERFARVLGALLLA